MKKEYRYDGEPNRIVRWSTKLGKDPKIAYSMHIRVNLCESWLMPVHKCDTHTRSPLFLPSVSIVLSATISLKIFFVERLRIFEF